MATNSVILNEDVLEHILKFVNGTTLANAEAVCTNWKSIITRLNKKYDIWRLCCEEEIPEEDLFDLLTKLYPHHWLPEGKKTVEWKTVYKHWKQWNIMPKWVYMVQKPPTDFGLFGNNYCFCIRSSGDWLLIGTKSCLLFYNMKNSFMTHVKTPGYVVSIDLHVVDNPEVKKDTYLPDLIPSDMVHRFEHDLALLFIKNYPPLCMSFDLHSGKLNVEINFTAEIEDSINVQERNLHRPRDYKFNFVKNMSCMNSKLYQSMIYSSPSKYANESLHSLQMEKLMIQDCCSLYIWHGKVEFLFSKEFIEIRVNDRIRKYHTLRDISLNLTAAFFYLNMLFLGFDLGTVLMFRVSKPEDLLELNLKNPTWSIKLSNSLIIGFEIIETLPRPTIVCNGVDKFYIIKFLSV